MFTTLPARMTTTVSEILDCTIVKRLGALIPLRA